MSDEAIGPNGKSLSLKMTLREPGELGGFVAWLASLKGQLDQGLQRLGCVHYARILPLEGSQPLRDRGVVLLIIEYDGETEEAFLTEFATKLREPLEKILAKMLGWAAPSSDDEFTGKFLAFAAESRLVEASLFSGYKGISVEKILKKTLSRESREYSPDGDLENQARPQATSPSTGDAFSLVMELEDPSKLRGLMLDRLSDKAVKDRIDAALESLDYVHFARFLPVSFLPDAIHKSGKALLLIVTEFDGHMEDYVMDFAAALDREFTMIIGYMKERPALPVSKHPHEFWKYVESHLQKSAYFFSSYPAVTVLDIADTTKVKKSPKPPSVPVVPVQEEDVQANVLKGIGAVESYHYHLQFGEPDTAREFLKNLKVTPSPITKPNEPPQKLAACTNIGFTYAGLEALRIEIDGSRLRLGAFPDAFRQGPAARAVRVGDSEKVEALDWRFGKNNEVHAVVSLHFKPDVDAKDKAKARDELEALFSLHQIKLMDRLNDRVKYAHAGKALDGQKIHFGYRDGITQPRIYGVHPDPNAVPGDFLLGPDFINSRGGRYIGSLPPALALNGTYAAYRVIQQYVTEFDNFLARAASETEQEPERVAAKLMGRWRNGAPLTSYPNGIPDDVVAQVDLQRFDYASPSGLGDDREGSRCPFGAHVRRLNPRSGMVLGVPWGRTVIRRGLPYTNEDASKGLVGMFVCADLESQFEFLLGVWGRQDLSSFGLRGTQDPFTATSPTKFTFIKKDGTPMPLEVPQLTKTIGSLYLFMPGMSGLGLIAHSTVAPKEESRSRSSNPELELPLNPASKKFRDDPYIHFAEFRTAQPVYKVAALHNSHWVLSHKLVTQVCEDKERFLKPGHNREPQPAPFGLNGSTDDGLFFMDPPRHTEIRTVMNGVFAQSIAALDQGKKQEDPTRLENINQHLLDSLPLGKGVDVDVASGYATRIAQAAFMEIMGIPDAMPPTERAMVAAWTKAMLAGRDPAGPREIRAAGGSASLALRSYLGALVKDQTRRVPGAAAPMTIMEGLRNAACPYVPPAMNADEVTNTASHFALGGYLSTEFLIITGIYNLLNDPVQWSELVEDKEGELLDRAVWEMLRFDAPFQMADRWVAQDCVLGDYPLNKGDKLTVVYGSANRDPEKFGSSADKFDIHRNLNTKEIYGFGHGIHRCIGEHLALKVARMAIGGFVSRYPNAKLAKTVEADDAANEESAWLPDPYFRSRKTLMVELGPPAN